MSNPLASIFLTDRMKDLPIESVAVYTFLRLKAESGSHAQTAACYQRHWVMAAFEDVQSIRQAFGTNKIRTERALDDLIKAGWIKPIEFEGVTAYVISESREGQWFVLADHAPRRDEVAQTSATLRQQATRNVTETKARAAKELARIKQEEFEKKRDEANQTGRTAGTWLARLYAARYEAKYGRTPIGFGQKIDAKTHAPFKRIWEALGGLEAGSKYLEFAFDTWETAITTFGLTNEPPSGGLLANPTFMQRLHNAMEMGYPKRAKKGGPDVDGIGNRGTTTD